MSPRLPIHRPNQLHTEHPVFDPRLGTRGLGRMMDALPCAVSNNGVEPSQLWLSAEKGVLEPTPVGTEERPDKCWGNHVTHRFPSKGHS